MPSAKPPKERVRSDDVDRLLKSVFRPKGTVYYVDATSGNDSNNGKSTALAWQTIAKVNGETFNPGESILFKRGETWREELTFPSSGIIGKPIILAAYGSGASPMINGADIVTGWAAYGAGAGSTWQSAFTRLAHQTFMDDVRLTEGADEDNLNDHEWFWVANVLYVRDDTGDPDGTGVVIECSIRDCCIYANAQTYITVDGIDTKYARNRNLRFDASTGITIRNQTISFSFYAGTYLDSAADFLIDNVVVHDTSEHHGFDCRNATSGTIRNSTMHTLPHSAVHLNEASNITIEYCLVYDCTSADDGSGVGGDEYSYCIIQNNTFYNCKYGGVDLTGIDVPCDYNIVRYNTFYNHTDFRAVLIWGKPAAGNFARYNKVYYNLFYDNRIAIQLDGRAQENEIFNNVFYNSTNEGLLIATDTGIHPSDNTFRNNIYEGANAYHVRDESNDATNTHDYNIYYDEHANCFAWNDIPVATFVAWRAASGQDAHSDLDNPDMVNPGADDFHLQVGSPCRNVGADVGLSPDFDGVSVPQETNPAIGAFEYVA